MSDPQKPVPIPFAGTISRRAFTRVQSLLLPWWARWYVFVPCVLFVFLSTGVGWSKAIASPVSAVPDLLLAGLVLAASAGITMYGRARAWRNAVSLTGRVSGAATTEGIEWNTANTSAKFVWEKLVRVREDGNLTLVFYAPRCAFYFPREFFNSEQAWSSFNEVLRMRLPR